MTTDNSTDPVTPPEGAPPETPPPGGQPPAPVTPPGEDRGKIEAMVREVLESLRPKQPEPAAPPVDMAASIRSVVEAVLREDDDRYTLTKLQQDVAEIRANAGKVTERARGWGAWFVGDKRRGIL